MDYSGWECPGSECGVWELCSHAEHNADTNTKPPPDAGKDTYSITIAHRDADNADTECDSDADFIGDADAECNADTFCDADHYAECNADAGDLHTG